MKCGEKISMGSTNFLFLTFYSNSENYLYTLKKF